MPLNSPVGMVLSKLLLNVLTSSGGEVYNSQWPLSCTLSKKTWQNYGSEKFAMSYIIGSDHNRSRLGS